MDTRNRFSALHSVFAPRKTSVVKASSRRRRRVVAGGFSRLGTAERLEQRAMMATFLVLNNSPNATDENSFAWAIEQSNNTRGDRDTIEFRISDGGTVISQTPVLPTITDAVTIDGTTQPGYLTSPIVEVDGTSTVGVGLRIASDASGTIIKGLSIYGFQYDPTDPDSGTGIVVEGGSNDNLITQCYVGTNAAGDTTLGNAVAGILVRGTGTIISSSVISGNDGYGIILDGDSGTSVIGSKIGTNASGNAALPNASHGIFSIGSSGTTIGDGTVAGRNIISGNSGDGVRLDGSTNVTFLGNYIGVDAATGAVAVPNGGAGISLDADATTIGDGTVGGRNVISGNDAQGILVRGGSSTTIQGNFIGTDATGNVGVGNVLEGVRFDGGGGHLVGGVAAGQGNVISANGGAGIAITAEAGGVTPVQVSGILVQQNLIGVGANLGRLGNGGDGISVTEASGISVTEAPGIIVTYRNRIAFNTGAGVRLTGASNNIVGADSTRDEGEQGLGFGNAIYANGLEGVVLESEANDNLVVANLIGLATPNGALQGNAANGIAVRSSRRNVIGGALPATKADPVYGNVIAANVAGVSLEDVDTVTAADSNVVLGNTIRNNVAAGIVVDNADSQVIGGSLATDANSIYLNGGNGVDIRNGSRAVVVSGNYVGTDASRVLGLGNAGIGIRVLQSNQTQVGGDSEAGEGNVVTGNGSDGVVITRVDDADVTGGQAIQNIVQGNTIRAGKGHGIRITAASENLIGSTEAGFGNTVVSNSLDGIRIENGADGNAVLGNTFGGAVSLGNGGAGVRVIASLENQIGSGEAGGGNTISRNAGAGIVIERARATDFANGNVVAGNTVDSNLSHGIVLAGSSWQTIGGLVGSAGSFGNSVTRNRGTGIRLTEDTATPVGQSDENVVGFNIVGTDEDGSNLGNTGHGIEIINGSFNSIVGNGVGFNLLSGVRVSGGQIGSDNVIGGLLPELGNLIGANKTGGVVVEDVALRTSILGTRVENNIGTGIDVRGSQNTTIGGGTTVVLSAGDGIVVRLQGAIDSTGTIVQDTYVGTDSEDATGLGNQGAGIRLAGVGGVTIGSGTVVAANRLGGVQIVDSKFATLAQGNVIRGATVRDNLTNGITVTGSTYQTIGGTLDGDANTITGNATDGIAILGNSAFVTVQANTVASNRRHGISVATANDNTINEGNEVTTNGLDGINMSLGAARNTISGNSIGQTNAGVEAGNTRDGIGITASNTNTIVGNLIGSNLRHGVAITAAVASGAGNGNQLFGNVIADNAQNGVTILGSRNQAIGAVGPDTANVITGNGLDGIFIGTGSSTIAVTGNLIGTDATGAEAGNGSDGIEVNAATGVVIRENTLMNNTANGLRIAAVKGSTAVPTSVYSNQILGNLANGVQVTASSGAVIGGTAQANIIGNNAAAGIRVDAASTGAVIAANFIGTDESGADLGNATEGVLVTGSAGNVIRGGNTVSFNATGIRVADIAVKKLDSGNRIESNLVTGNDGNGIEVAGATYQTVGGVNLGNTITLNGGDGIAILPSGRSVSSNIVVRDNLIGTDESQVALGNEGNGVSITGGSANTVDLNIITDNLGTGVVVAGSSFNVIGSAVVGQGNVIRGNGEGVQVTDSLGLATVATRSNVVAGNAITGSTGNGVTVSGARTVLTTIGGGTLNNRPIGAANAIFGNEGIGVSVESGAQQVAMQSNSIYDNVAGQIDLAEGTNNGRVIASITSAVMTTPSGSVSQLSLTGSLAGVRAGQQYQLSVYSNRPEDGDAATGTGYGGRDFVGRVTLTASASGTLRYSVKLPAGGVDLGEFISVLATTVRPPAGTSSAFSEIAAEVALRGTAIAPSGFAALASASAAASSTSSTGTSSRTRHRVTVVR
jgi:parallel beta-helix repeat protein